MSRSIKAIAALSFDTQSRQRNPAHIPMYRGIQKAAE